MEANKAQAGPALPNLITAFRKGFDAVANHITLILLPLAMDLWIWLGLHLQIKSITNDVLQWITETAALDPNYQPGLLDANLEMLRAVQERLNVMIFLRTYPVGLPSLMAGRLPVESPLSATPFVDISSSGTVLVLWVLLSLVGLALGSLYFTLVAQAALDGALDLRKALSRWPGAALQSLFLALLVMAVLFAVSAPASCLLTLLAQGGVGAGQMALFIYLTVLMWVTFPLLFSPHGIFAYGDSMQASLRKSIRLARLTFPTTSLLFLAVLMASELLDMLWRVPPENSWLTLAGLVGHAFITTALLATTFVYYRDADLWVQAMLERLQVKVV